MQGWGVVIPVVALNMGCKRAVVEFTPQSRNLGGHEHWV